LPVQSESSTTVIERREFDLICLIYAFSRVILARMPLRRGKWAYLSPKGTSFGASRAVDEHGAELDVLVQKRRDKAAAKRFFRRVLRSNPVPRKIVTDQLRSYPAAKADIPELAQVKRVFVKAAARVNNRPENSHQPIRRRERQMCSFRDERRTQAFLSCFGPIRQHFALPRHKMNAVCHRTILKERLATWHGWTVSAAVDYVI
jgi:putative transposase